MNRIGAFSQDAERVAKRSFFFFGGRMNIKFRVFWIIASILIMGIIFYFSSQGSGQSEDLSDAVAEVLHMEQKEETTRVSNQGLFFGLTLRKLAHIVLFAGLGFCLFFALTGVKGRIIWAAFAAYAYGAFDELHQTWSGRYGRWQDTLIDLLGIVLGIIAALIIIKIWQKMKAQRQKQSSRRQVL